MSKVPIILAKRFVAGEHLDDALRVARKLKEKNILTTIDHLGEEVKEKKKAQQARETYIAILKKIAHEGLRANISIKLTQLGLAIDKHFALRNVQKIVACAKKYHLTVEVDMEGSRYTQDTIDIFSEVQKKQSNMMLAIQSYLHRSKTDIVSLLKNHANIRLVKGGYKEPPETACKDKRDTDRQYIELMNLYLEKGHYLAIATHDEKIINRAKQKIRREKIPKSRFEFEMLYGIRPALQEKLAKEGYTVRVYVPYGEEWFAYYYRRLRERKENLFFALKHVFKR